MGNWSESWNPLGVVRFVSRIYQDEFKGSSRTTNETCGNDDEEDIRTRQDFLEFEANALEQNLTEQGDHEQTAAVDDLNHYFEQRYKESRSVTISAPRNEATADNEGEDESLKAELQYAVERGRFRGTKDFLGLVESQELHNAVRKLTAANTQMETVHLSTTKSLATSPEIAMPSLIRAHSAHLYSHFRDEFSRMGEGHQHEAMLQLSGLEEDHQQNSSPCFKLFLSPCPPSGLFHETHCTVTDSECSPDDAEKEKICLSIQQYSIWGRVLHVSFNKSYLWVSPKKQNFTWDLAVPRISLRQLLDVGAFSDHKDRSRTFTKKDKYLLVLNLARCFFYFYDGPWAPNDWNADHIFFLNKVDSDIIHGRHIPYICCALPGNDQRKTLELRQGEACPSVLLSFARLLLEIERGEVIQPPRVSDIKNQELYRQLQTIVEHEIRDQTADSFRDAIAGCLEFSFDLGRASGTTMEMKIRHTIFWNILDNLKKHYSVWQRSPPENADLRFAPGSSKGQRKTKVGTSSRRQSPAELTPSLPSHIRSFSDNLVQTVKPDLSLRASACSSTLTLFDDEDITRGVKSASRTSLGFMNLMNDFNREYILRYSIVQENIISSHSMPKNPVRIAVLDTGISTHDNQIRGAKSRIRGYWSPLKSERASIEDCEDYYGHGTHVTRILLGVAPSAHIFVAKISEGKDLEESKVGHIAEAIKWAIDVCDVHIITMSFGLTIRSKVVTDAIDSAIDRGKLVFAAASNTGGNGPRAYPASLTGVICIHATDGEGNQSNFNPSSEKGADNFATLGTAIKSQWKGETVFKSGTSFATPIAVGIAANILEFASHQFTDESDRRKYERLCSYTGMRLMFKCMSTERGNYDYISPWKVFRPITEGTIEDQIQIIRVNIRSLLNTDKIPAIWNW